MLLLALVFVIARRMTLHNVRRYAICAPHERVKIPSRWNNVADFGIKGSRSLPLTDIYRRSPIKVTSTRRGRGPQNPLYLPAYFDNTSGATATAVFSSSEALPTQFSGLFAFSSASASVRPSRQSRPRSGVTSVHHEGGDLSAIQKVRARADLLRRVGLSTLFATDPSSCYGLLTSGMGKLTFRRALKDELQSKLNLPRGRRCGGD